MSEQKPSHEVKGIVCRAPRQDCVKEKIWGRVTKIRCDQDPDSYSERALEYICGDERTFLPEGQSSQQHSANQDFLVEPPLSKRHMTARYELAKKHLKTLRPSETRFSGMMQPR